MSAPDPIDQCTLDGVMGSLEPVLSYLNRRLFEDGGLDVSGDVGQHYVEESGSLAQTQEHPFLRRWHSTSNSACYEKTRAGGGQTACLYELSTTGAMRLATSYVMSDMRYFERVLIDGAIRYCVVVTFYRPELETFFGPLLNQLRKSPYSDRPEVLRCMIQGVIEPLKVRVISKGPALPYYFSKPLQERVHTLMRQMPCFALIGAPVTGDRLVEVAANHVPFTFANSGDGGRLEWFSIDYSAATDGLSATLSAAILASLTRGCPRFERNMWASVLAPHMIDYPPLSGVASVMEENGQLMGSILSFIVLCLANLGLYLYLLRDDARSVWEKMKGVLVNGDDMLYAAPSGMWREHVAVGKKVGLEMSVGKAYHHNAFASVNSQCFLASLKHGSFGTPTQVPFFNVGLFFGRNKVMQGANVDDAVKEASRLSTVREVLSGVWRPYGKAAHAECSVFAAFIGLHRAELEAEARGRNWFIHESLGGCGVPIPDGWKWKVDEAQVAYAAERFEEITRSCGNVEPDVFGPVRSPMLQPLFSKQRAPWHTNAIDNEDREVQRKLRAPCVVTEEVMVWTDEQYVFDDDFERGLEEGQILSKRFTAIVRRSRPRSTLAFGKPLSKRAMAQGLRRLS
jgi:hypothetical protein